MTAIFGFCFLGVTALTTILIGRSIISDLQRPGPLLTALTEFLLFFAFLLAPFFLLGFVELVSGVRAVNIPAALGVGLFGCLAAYVYSRRVQRRPKSRSPVATDAMDYVDRRTSILGWGTLAVFVAVGVMAAAGYPRGYEPAAYHLPIAVRIFQARSLAPWDLLWQHALPANASLYYGLLLQLVPEKLVSSASLVFLLPIAGAVFGIARSLHADKSASALTAMGTLSIPLVALGALDAGADVPGLAFLACGVYFAFAERPSTTTRMILSGICVGLAVGFKSLHLVSVGVLGVLVALQVVPAGSHGSSWRALVESGRRVLIFVSMALAFASFWLVRNWVIFGNPVYPVYLGGVFDLLGWKMAPDADLYDRHFTQSEWVRYPFDWLGYPWREWNSIGKNFTSNSGLGPYFAATVPVTVVAIAIGWVTRRIQVPRSVWLLFLGGCLVVAVWWVLGDRQPRYVMGALVYFMPVAAWVVSKVTGRGRMLQDTVLQIAIVYMLLVVLSTQLMTFGDRIVYSRQTSRASYYEYPAVLDNLPRGATVVNLGSRTWNYPLFGKGAQNAVISYLESLRVFADLPPVVLPPVYGDEIPLITLTEERLRAVGATHLYVIGRPQFAFDGCVTLKEVDRLDRNPVNRVKLGKPRVLYEIHYCR